MHVRWVCGPSWWRVGCQSEIPGRKVCSSMPQSLDALIAALDTLLQDLARAETAGRER